MFRRATKSVSKALGAQSMRVNFAVEIQDIELPQLKDLGPNTLTCISLERGGKVCNSKEYQPVKVGAGSAAKWKVDINETLSVSTSLFKDPSGMYQEKKARLIVKYRKKSVLGGESLKVIGEAYILLNKVAESGTNGLAFQGGFISLPLLKCSEEGAAVTVKITALASKDGIDDGASEMSERESIMGSNSAEVEGDRKEWWSLVENPAKTTNIQMSKDDQVDRPPPSPVASPISKAESEASITSLVETEETLRGALTKLGQSERKCDALSGEIQELRAQLLAANKQNSELTMQLSQSDHDLSVTTEKLHKAQTESDSLRQRQQDSSASVSALQAKEEELLKLRAQVLANDQRLRDSDALVSAQREELQSLKMSSQSAHSQLQECHNQIIEYQTKLNDSQAELEQREDEVAILRGSLKICQGQLREAQQTMDGQDEEIARLRRESQASQGGVSAKELDDLLHAKEEEVAVARNSLRATQVQLSEAQSASSKWTAMVADLKTRLCESEAMVTHKEKEISVLKADLTEIRQRLPQTEAKILSWKDTALAKQEELETKISEQEKTISQKNDEVDRLRGELNRLKMEAVETASTSADVMALERGSLMTQIEQLDSELADTRKQLGKSKSESDGYRQALEKERLEFSQSMKEEQKALETVKSQVGDLTEELEKTRKALDVDRHEAGKALGIAKEQVRDLTEELEKTKRDLDVERKEAQRGSASLDATNARLTDQLRALETSNASLLLELQKLKLEANADRDSFYKRSMEWAALEKALRDTADASSKAAENTKTELSELQLKYISYERVLAEGRTEKEKTSTALSEAHRTIADLEIQKMDLLEKLAQQHIDIEKLQNDMKTILSEKQDVQKKLQVVLAERVAESSLLDSHTSDMTRKLEEAKRQSELILERNVELERSLSQKLQELEETNAKVFELEDLVAVRSNELVATKSENIRFKSDVEVGQNRITDLETLVGTQATQVANARTELESIRKQLRDLEMIHSHRAAEAEVKEVVEMNLQAELRSVSSRLVDSEAAVVRLVGYMASKEEEVTSLKEKLVDSEVQNQKIAGIFADMKSKLSEFGMSQHEIDIKSPADDVDTSSVTPTGGYFDMSIVDLTMKLIEKVQKAEIQSNAMSLEIDDLKKTLVMTDESRNQLEGEYQSLQAQLANEKTDRLSNTEYLEKKLSSSAQELKDLLMKIDELDDLLKSREQAIKELEHTLQTQKDRIEFLETSQENLSSLIATRESELKTLQEEHDKVKWDMSAKDVDLEAQRNDNHLLRTQIAVTANRINEQEEAIIQLQSQLRIETESKRVSEELHTATLRDEITSTYRRLEDKDHEIESLRADLSVTKKALEDMRRDREGSEADAKAQQSRGIEMELLVSRYESDMAAVRDELEALRAKQYESEDAIASLTADCAQKLDQLSAAKSEIQALRTGAAGGSNRVSELEAIISSQAAHMTTKDESLAFWRSELEAITQERQSLSTQLSEKVEIERKLTNDIKALEIKFLQTLESEKMLQHRVKNLEEELLVTNRLQESLIAKSVQLQSSGQEQAGLKDLLDSSIVQLEIAEERNRELELRISMVERERSQMLGSLNELRGVEAETRRECEGLRAVLMKERQERVDQQSLVDNLRTQIRDLSDRHNEMMVIVEKQSMNLEKKDQLLFLQEEKALSSDAVKQTIENKNREIAGLSEKLLAAQAEVYALQTSLSSLRKDRGLPMDSFGSQPYTGLDNVQRIFKTQKQLIELLQALKTTGNSSVSTSYSRMGISSVSQVNRNQGQQNTVVLDENTLRELAQLRREVDRAYGMLLDLNDGTSKARETSGPSGKSAIDTGSLITAETVNRIRTELRAARAEALAASEANVALQSELAKARMALGRLADDRGKMEDVSGLGMSELQQRLVDKEYEYEALLQQHITAKLMVAAASQDADEERVKVFELTRRLQRYAEIVEGMEATIRDLRERQGASQQQTTSSPLPTEMSPRTASSQQSLSHQGLAVTSPLSQSPKSLPSGSLALVSE